MSSTVLARCGSGKVITALRSITDKTWTMISSARSGGRNASSCGSTSSLTDDFGHRAVEGKVHMHDLHATVLHLLGLDHERLTHRYAGRDFRLTDVAGRVVREILV